MRIECCEDSHGSLCYLRSYSGTLWWYPDRSRIDEVHAYSLQLDRAHLPQRDFVEFSNHFRTKILDEYGIEVAIQTIANPEYTTFVVKSREEERFVNEIHDHRQELRSSNELLANLHESGRNEEGKVTRSQKETWAAPSTDGN